MLREAKFHKESSLDCLTHLIYSALLPLLVSHIQFSLTAASRVYIAFHPVVTLVFCSKNCSEEFPQFTSRKQEVLTQLSGMRENNLELSMY